MASFVEPDAHVRYCLDQKTKSVPFSWFKKKFQPNEHWKYKSYLVFFSPDDEVTPMSLLHSLSELPVFETAEDLDRHTGDPLGFDRATVTQWAGSKEALEELISRKRQRCVPLELVMETSFEEQKRNISLSKINTRVNNQSSRQGRSLKKGKVVEVSTEVRRVSARSNVHALKMQLIASNGSSSVRGSSTTPKEASGNKHSREERKPPHGMKSSSMSVAKGIIKLPSPNPGPKTSSKDIVQRRPQSKSDAIPTKLLLDLKSKERVTGHLVSLNYFF